MKKGQLLIAQYEGVIWRNDKVFDSTWKNGTPAGFEIGVGQVVKGWDDGLVGKRVGSQVVLVVPPADGYGKSGSSTAGIKGTDTLVFVVDILGTYWPALHHAPAITALCGRSCGQSLPRFLAARMIWVTR